MKSLLRGFLVGFGFSIGASTAGILIGYGVGKLGEVQIGRMVDAHNAKAAE